MKSLELLPARGLCLSCMSSFCFQFYTWKFWRPSELASWYPPHCYFSEKCGGMCRICLYGAESKEMWSQFGPPLCHSPAQTSKASSKLKTGSLSQGNAVTSKARIIIRVSYEDHYLGDVAILNLGKTSSRVQSSSQLDLEKCCIPHQTEAFLQLSAKFIWVNSSTSNCKRFEHSHQDRLDREVLTPSRPANAPS